MKVAWDQTLEGQAEGSGQGADMESYGVLDEGHDILRKITPGAREEVEWERGKLRTH